MREAGPISSAAIAGAMRALRHPDFASMRCALSTTYVDAAEAALGITLPDDVLALIACDAPAIRNACGLCLEEAANWNEAVHNIQYAPDELVGLGYLCDNGNAFWATAPDDADREWSTYHSYVVCIPRNASREGPTTVTLWPQFENKRSALSMLLRDLVARNLGARYRSVPESGEAFKPALVAPTPPAPLRRVRHAKFGEGTIVSQKDDQLTIDFGEHGTKRIKAAYVTLL